MGEEKNEVRYKKDIQIVYYYYLNGDNLSAFR